MNHQEWEPVVFHKKKEPKKKVHFQSPPKEVDIQTKRIKVYTKEMANAVMTSRISKKLTRDQLAKMCNVVPAVMTEIENQKGVYDANLANKVCKILGIKVETRFYQI
jgi:ribosome-binding protein aMBF1 (putative translation factor)